MITRENFEIFAADFLDGKLSPEDTILFLAFLHENPDLKDLLSDMEEFSLSPEPEVFPAKNTLHKDFTLKTKATADNFDEFAVASSEHILTRRQEENLELYLSQHPEKQQDLDLFRKVHLSPDLSVRFPSRKALYHGRKRNLLYYRNAFAAAASILLLAGLYILLEKPFSGTHSSAGTAVLEIPSAEKPSEETRSVDRSPNPEKQEYPATVTRTGITREKIPASVTTGTDQHSEEVALKEIRPLPLQPVPYTYPSLGMLATQTVTSDNLQQKPREEYRSLPELASMEIRKRIKPASANDNTPITLLDIAEAGINSLSRLTGAKIRLDKKYDPQGNLIAVDFESPLFALSAPVKKNN